MSQEKLNIDKIAETGHLEINGSAEETLYPERKFRINKRLITVDAPDGSGKGAIAKIVRDQLATIYGNENVILVCPTRFETSNEGLRIEEFLKKHNGLPPDSVGHNLHFMGALRMNYRRIVIPALNDGKIVVVDSSEIRSLAFILDRGYLDTAASTLGLIKKGTATSNLLAGNRIIIETSCEDCLANIKARGKTDYGDPTDIKEAKRRSDSYKIAISTISGLDTDHPPNFIVVQNPRVETPDLQEYLNRLVAEKIVPLISL